jgi:hypothetical protein
MVKSLVAGAVSHTRWRAPVQVHQTPWTGASVCGGAGHVRL